MAGEGTPVAAQGGVARVMDRLMVVLLLLIAALVGAAILALYLGWVPFSWP